jgi:hypothetical protein
MQGNKRKYAATGAGLASLIGLVATSLPSNAATVLTEDPITGTTTTRANLEPLNDSGVDGASKVVVHGRKLNVTVKADRLLKEMPHAQHIHFGAKARHECPTVRDDANHDHRLNTLEGQPAYGRVRVSLTTRGDTSPASTLAVNRFPTAEDRQINYERNITTSKRVARGIRNGNAVVVIHGIDYNGNGKYDFRGAGKSELDPSLPAEATDTVSCGVLKEVQASPSTP